MQLEDQQLHEQDADGTMQLLISLLKDLNKALKDSEGSGTPAIHMYSILDQVAALHEELNKSELCSVRFGLHEVDAELICILKHCKDDEKRKRVRGQNVVMTSIVRLRFFVSLSGHCPPNLWLRFSQISLASSSHRESRQKKFARSC